MAYEIKVDGGTMVEDASKYVGNDGVLNEYAPAPVSNAVGVDTVPTEQVAYNLDGSVDDGTSFFDKFKTSKVRVWNPETARIEEEEIPTWQRAAKGMAVGLKSYGLSLLRNGGDQNKAWADGIETAFGDLNSERAADAKNAAHKAEISKLMTDAKYTPESIAMYSRTNDPRTLVQKEQVLTADQKRQGGQWAAEHGLSQKEFEEKIRSAKVNESISWTNAQTAQYNAQTSRFNAEMTVQEIEGEDGNKYIIPFNLRTEEKGKPILKDSVEGKKLLEKNNNLQKEVNAANNTLDLINTMSADEKGMKSAVGYFDSKAPTVGEDASRFESNHNSLTSNMFLDSVSRMRGTGALSDAEGKKLENAIAGLSLSMNQAAYKKQLEKVKQHYVKLIETVEKERQGKGVQPTATAPRESQYESLYR